MKTVLRIEEALMFAFALYLNSLLAYPGWYFWAWFLAPDLGFLGYLAGNRAGAIVYNILHHKGVAILLGVAGLYFGIPSLQLTAVILFGHSSFDRMLGYGLKYADSFQNTHLGPIGRRKPA